METPREPSGGRGVLTFVVVALVTVLGVLAFSAPLGQNGGRGPGECPLPVAGGVRVALVEPLFTSTPYSHEFAVNGNLSFYGFYANRASLAELSTPIMTDPAFAWDMDQGLYRAFLSSPLLGECGLTVGQGVAVLTDVQVSQGALSSGYNFAVLGHEEYVTASEYDNLRSFVAGGGTLLVMGGNTFWAEVNYTAGVETLWRGHGWIFNGTAAVPSAVQPFNASNADWFGSNYLCETTYANCVELNPTVSLPSNDPVSLGMASLLGGSTVNPPENGATEVNVMANGTDRVIFSWAADVAAYAHPYREGRVVCLSVNPWEMQTSPFYVDFMLATFSAYAP